MCALNATSAAAIRDASAPQRLLPTLGIRARILLTCLLVAFLASCDRYEPIDLMQRVERTGFTMDAPVWSVRHDEDARMVGSYAVQQGRRLVEVNWTPSGASSITELEQLGAGILQGFGFTARGQRHEILPDQLRLHLTFSIPRPGWGLVSQSWGGLDKGWGLITLIQCMQSGVMVTMGVTDERRAPAVAMHERVLSTLVCPDDASVFASVWPRTNIPEDFGVLNGESIILGHRDGRWLLVSAMTPSTVRNMERSHHSALQMFSSLGNVVGVALNPMATASPGRTLSGRASVWFMEPANFGPMVATTLVCIDEGIAYLILAGDDSHESDHSALEALSLRFACPEGRTRPSLSGELTPLLERPGVCEVGAEEFCNTLADAQ